MVKLGRTNYLLYFYGKNLKSYRAFLKSGGGAAPYPTFSIAYVWPVHAYLSNDHDLIK